MKCPRCHNEDPQYFYKVNNQTYCRKCIAFNKVILNESRKTKHRDYYPVKLPSYYLPFELSNVQKDISYTLLENYKNHLNSLVLAVCGSGKTEIVFETIAYALAQGDRICFCVPRSEIVKELYERIKEAFKDADIGIIVGGRKENEHAQFIICTMHQLYRFENDIGFDLMIADEVDAFPFYNNKVLNEIFKRCTLKSYIKLSATFFKEDIGDEQLLIMNRRYHGYDLPNPYLILLPNCLHKICILKLIRKWNKKTLLFVPYISQVEELCTYLNNHHIKCSGVSSASIDVQHHIECLKKGNIQVLVTTTLLERGITIEDVQVIVYQASHKVFDKRTLIQIAGRVGRKPGFETGNVCFIADKKTKDIFECISSIKRLNQTNV